MKTVYHFSMEPNIKLFEPRTGTRGFEDQAIIWAIDREHLPNYLFPRDCPRVTFFARPDSDPAEVERLMGKSKIERVVAVESGWYERIRDSRLHQYQFDARTFTSADEIAGYSISHEPVEPISERRIDDVLAELLQCNVELRFLPSLWELREQVIRSTLGFSIIRMRNAQPPEEGYDAYHPLPT